MKLQVIMINRFDTQMALMHENSFVPHRKRVVSISLTDEQIENIRPRFIGTSNGTPVFEEFGECWIDTESDGLGFQINPACVCGETSTRNCPVHGNEEEPKK